jgi:alginate O-acetyltransferase complex protein AlgI
MLFHTWPFAVFFLVVLAGFFALSRTRFWVFWLLVASYVFYGWWNPYYLVLILYSTALDYVIVACMDHCPQSVRNGSTAGRSFGGFFRGLAGGEPGASAASRRLLRVAFSLFGTGALASMGVMIAGPGSVRSLMGLLTVILGLMAFGAMAQSRFAWLIVSLVNNLGILIFFKYANFFVENVNAVLAWFQVGVRVSDPALLMPFGLEYLLPVGISFYTFQSMSYTIDFYQGKIHRERSFVRFATFVSFFPQLVAGPIERSSNLLPQFNQFPKIRLRDVTDGMSLFLVGLFKKLALANYLSFYVERVYENPAAQDASALMLGTFCFAWQIFFDFSGYTDMARGVAQMMGFRLMLNFNNPYLATGLGDFWSRWHISLSTWFRDYIYIPLGGNRNGSLRTYRNLLITLVVSAIWHGAAWTFVIWGVLHALGVVITRELERSPFYRESVPKWIKQIGVFCFVCFAWIFFRAETLSDAWLIVRRMATGGWTDPNCPALLLLLVAAIWGYQFLYDSKWRPLLRHGAVRIGVAASMILYMFLFSSGGGAFIYFQF